MRIGAALAREAKQAGVSFRAVAADCAYGDQDGFRSELVDAGLPFVMALKPRHGIWARGDQAHTPVDAARVLTWGGPRDPGDWNAVIRRFRDGHTETWWAADARLGWWGPDGTTRLVVAKSRTNSDGPTSRSAPTPRSAATRPWSTARSRCAGTPGSPRLRPRPWMPRSWNRTAQRGGTPASHRPRKASWPQAIRAVRGWLAPWTTLQRYWRAWSTKPPPTELQTLINALGTGRPIELYIPV
ncbi:hypothetical protein ACIRL2_38810 [Embleya sp. NPDC127516]|uniref:hypothetical protein n=1 Tax=Embleya sp. NPDC127516 TaxID=3363990 RepID=UPI00381D3634